MALGTLQLHPEIPSWLPTRFFRVPDIQASDIQASDIQASGLKVPATGLKVQILSGQWR
jgi:hypothetical protein